MKCISRCSPYNIAALVSISLISSLKKAAGQLHSKKTSHYTDTDRVERWYPLEKAKQTPLFLITLRLYS